MSYSNLTFTWDKYWWTTSARLPFWDKFQVGRGTFRATREPSGSSRLVRIVFAPEGRDNEPLTHAEVSSVSWFMENESSIADSLLNSLIEKYPSLRQLYGYSTEDEANLMPDVTTVDDFRSLIGLHSVNVHQISRDGVPYVGFEFGCSWDDEHGLGVLMHGTRTVKIGGADTAILLWIAKRDAQQG